MASFLFLFLKFSFCTETPRRDEQGKKSEISRDFSRGSVWLDKEQRRGGWSGGAAGLNKGNSRSVPGHPPDPHPADSLERQEAVPGPSVPCRLDPCGEAGAVAAPGDRRDGRQLPLLRALIP